MTYTELVEDAVQRINERLAPYNIGQQERLSREHAEEKDRVQEQQKDTGITDFGILE